MDAVRQPTICGAVWIYMCVYCVSNCVWVFMHILYPSECFEVCGLDRELHISVCALTHTHRLIECRKQCGDLGEDMGECVLSTTAINYKALGMHVLISGINVSSFPPHTPPFASINSDWERKSVRASEREREAALCFVWRRWEQTEVNGAEKRTVKQQNHW